MPPSGDSCRLHVTIDGTVQGVGFRQFVSNEAKALGLTGWVRNTYDGRVEVTAEGQRAPLEKLLLKLRMGPRLAYVSTLDYDWLDASGEFSRFNVARTV